MMLQLHDEYLGANLSKVRRDIIKTPRQNLVFTETQPVLPVWPPISWDKYKPTTYAAIENHYYNFSPGCSNTFLGKVLEGMVYAAGAVATFFTAGLAAPIAASASAAAAGVSAAAGQLVKNSIENAAENAVKNGIDSATASMQGTGRKRIDSGAEVDEIRRTYINNYRTWANLSYLETYTKPQLENKLQQFQDSLDGAHAKCKKSPCDRPGCRASGILALRVQYVQLLLDAYNATNTTTPAEYNQVISAEFFKNIPAQDLVSVVQKIKEEKAKKTAAVGAFLILGALFSGLLKKS